MKIIQKTEQSDDYFVSLQLYKKNRYERFV